MNSITLHSDTYPPNILCSSRSGDTLSPSMLSGSTAIFISRFLACDQLPVTTGFMVIRSISGFSAVYAKITNLSLLLFSLFSFLSIMSCYVAFGM